MVTVTAHKSTITVQKMVHIFPVPLHSPSLTPRPDIGWLRTKVHPNIPDLNLQYNLIQEDFMIEYLSGDIFTWKRSAKLTSLQFRRVVLNVRRHHHCIKIPSNSIKFYHEEDIKIALLPFLTSIPLWFFPMFQDQAGQLEHYIADNTGHKII